MNNKSNTLNHHDNFTFEESTDYLWLAELAKTVARKYIISGMCAVGTVFNLVSAVILLRNGIKLKRSLAILFAFLNISDM